MSFAVVALMVAASACGNNAKKAEAAEGEATEEAVEAEALAAIQPLLAAIQLLQLSNFSR